MGQKTKDKRWKKQNHRIKNWLTLMMTLIKSTYTFWRLYLWYWNFSLFPHFPNVICFHIPFFPTFQINILNTFKLFATKYTAKTIMTRVLLLHWNSFTDYEFIISQVLGEVSSSDWKVCLGSVKRTPITLPHWDAQLSLPKIPTDKNQKIRKILSNSDAKIPKRKFKQWKMIKKLGKWNRLGVKSSLFNWAWKPLSQKNFFWSDVL